MHFVVLDLGTNIFEIKKDKGNSMKHQGNLLGNVIINWEKKRKLNQTYKKNQKTQMKPMTRHKGRLRIIKENWKTQRKLNQT